MKRSYHGQMSESFVVGILLCLCGGFQDAYTYVCRDKVFANAQTGNIVLLGNHLAQQDWSGAVRYAVPRATLKPFLPVTMQNACSGYFCCAEGPFPLWKERKNPLETAGTAIGNSRIVCSGIFPDRNEPSRKCTDFFFLCNAGGQLPEN